MREMPKALLFDVFGTVVDWRSSVIDACEKLIRDKKLELDCAQFADAWRGLYSPSMQQVRCGKRPWVSLDVLHKESLLTLLDQFAPVRLSVEEIDQLNRVWHKLRPWSDSVSGLTRLKQKYVIATLTNGNIELMVNLAKFAKLPWDMLLGAEIARQYKPMPTVYLSACSTLGLKPQQCMLVAAHNSDLKAAQKLGFATAFVARPTEHGSAQKIDLKPTGDWDIIASDLIDLSTQLT